MKVEEIIAGIDQEIARFQQVKALLSGGDITPRRGRPATTANEAPVKKRRPLSPEARARIVAAQKKRWARQKKQPNG